MKHLPTNYVAGSNQKMSDVTNGFFFIVEKMHTSLIASFLIHNKSNFKIKTFLQKQEILLKKFIKTIRRFK